MTLFFMQVSFVCIIISLFSSWNLGSLFDNFVLLSSSKLHKPLSYLVYVKLKLQAYARFDKDFTDV